MDEQLSILRELAKRGALSPELTTIYEELEKRSAVPQAQAPQAPAPQAPAAPPVSPAVSTAPPQRTAPAASTAPPDPFLSVPIGATTGSGRTKKVNPWVDVPSQFGSGVVEGLASIPDGFINAGAAPGGLAAWPLRGPARLATKGAEYMGWVSPETAQGVEEYLNPPPVQPFQDRAAMNLPEPIRQGSYPFIRKSGQVTGSNLPFAVGGLFRGAATAAAQGLAGTATRSAPSLVSRATSAAVNTAKTAGKETFYGTLGAAGDSGGRAVADAVAPGNATISDLFGIAGSVGSQVTPHGGGLAKAEGTKKFLGNRANPETAKETFAASERLGITDELAPATFGGDNMKTMSQWLGMLPFLGGNTGDLLRKGSGVIQNRLTEVSNKIRNGQPADIDNLGVNIQDVGDLAAHRAEGKASGAMQSAESAVGGSTPTASLTPIDQTFQNIYKGDPNDPSLGAIGADPEPAVKQRERMLNKKRTTPVDAATHTRLTARQAKLEADLKSAQATLKMRQQSATATNTAPTFHAQNRVDRLTRDLETVKQDIHDNMGLEFSQLKSWTSTNRAQANAPPTAGGNIGLPQGYAGKLTDAGREVQIATADKVSPAVGQQYREATQLWDTIMHPETGSVPYVRQGIPESRVKPDGSRQHTGTAKQAQDWLTDGNMNVHEKFQAMQDVVDHAISNASSPQEAAAISQKWAQVRGDLIDKMGQKSAGNRTENSAAPKSEFSSDTYATSHENLTHKETADILAGGDAQALKDMEDLASVAKGQKATGREQNASRTAKHAIYTSLATGGVGAGISQLLASGLPSLSIGAGLGMAATPAIIKAVDRFASSPQTSRDLVFGAAGKKRIADLIARAKTASGGAAISDLFGPEHGFIDRDANGNSYDKNHKLIRQ